MYLCLSLNGVLKYDKNIFFFISYYLHKVSNFINCTSRHNINRVQNLNFSVFYFLLCISSRKLNSEIKKIVKKLGYIFISIDARFLTQNRRHKVSFSLYFGTIFEKNIRFAFFFLTYSVLSSLILIDCRLCHASYDMHMSKY